MLRTQRQFPFDPHDPGGDGIAARPVDASGFGWRAAIDGGASPRTPRLAPSSAVTDERNEWDP
ncbi:hypothetical protein [Natrinema salaciae]|uniref:Uncharacterized protein n=1 Tax=Natrinema salaciae TaxID=1186196 RepID=A0A1H9A845_9EURY|nr:hypothetical protein [Natrinema salaciae]SEP72840.1 hypothetical protein SAMN04489841_0377 [Natrinema salaciae]